MDKFIVNIIHRPEMVPEYAEKVTGHGKEENIGRRSLLTESLDIFKFQQETAHKNGLKTTIQMTYASLFNEEAISIAKEHHEKYGDEIALSLLGLPCEEFREKYKTKDFCIWMFSMEDKKSIVDDVFGKFHDIFGFYPESTGSYYIPSTNPHSLTSSSHIPCCSQMLIWPYYFSSILLIFSEYWNRVIFSGVFLKYQYLSAGKTDLFCSISLLCFKMMVYFYPEPKPHFSTDK